MGGIVEAIVNVVSSFISWLIPIPEVPEFDTPDSENAQGVLLNKESNNAQIPVVYGQRKLGVTRVYVETSGSDNQYLYVAGVLCEGEIESIESIFIDDREVTFDGALTHGTTREVDSSDTVYYKDSTSHIQVQAFLGKDDQVASSVLTSQTNWGTNHRLRGVAYLAFRFKWNQDIFGAIPNVKAVIKGKKVYDPRTTTTAYSNNSALCLLDYLRNSRYGKGLPDDAFETNFQSFQDAANECETQVTPYSGGSDINLFETNGVLDTSQKVIDNVKKLLNPMRAFFTYTEGVYKLTIEGTGTAVKTINSDNVVGGAKLLGERKNNKYNRIIATFVNPNKNYQEDTISYPPNDDSSLPSADQHATMLADDGVLLEGNYSFPNVTSVYQAQGLAEVILRRSRNQLQVQVRVTSEFLDVAVGDIVQIYYPTGGFNNKPFRVLGMTINEDLTVDLQLFEHQDNFYSWSTKAQAPTIADTTLPNPNSVQPPASLTLSDELVEYNDGTVITRLTSTIGASPDAFVEQYEVEAKQTLDADGNAVSDNYRLIGQGVALDYQLLNVIDGGTYEVRARAINTLGVKSTFVTATRLIIGSTAIPADVEDFNISMTGSNQMQLSWTPVQDLDIEFYEIRYSTGVSPTDWFNTTNLVQVPRRKSNSVTINAIEPPYHLYIKAVDKLGNESANATGISSNVTRLENFESIGTVNEETAFTGTFSNTFLGEDANANPAVTLDTISLFDSTAGNFEDPDALGYFFDTGGVANNIRSSGNYVFDNTFSLDAIYDATFQVQITMQSDDPYDLFDLGRGATLFDDAKAPFDGTAPSNCTSEIAVGASNTSLGAISSYTTISQQGTFTGRYFKFKANLKSSNNQAKPLITGLQVKLVLEKRAERGDDVASGTSTKTITFTNNFYATPNITVTGQDLASGDYWTITNKSKTGFDIVFKNSSDVNINRTFDYVANGYGLQT
jgi:hypothetical protein